MKTKIKLLQYLIEHKKAELSIRQLAKALKIDYKNLYMVVRGLEKEGVLRIETFGHANRLRLVTKIHPLLLETELERRSELLKDKNLAVMLHQIEKDMGTTLYILLLFGSYAKRTQTKHSDIDLLFIVPDGTEAQAEKKIHQSVNILPLKIHPLPFTESQFKEMLAAKEPNVGTEARDNNIILYNIESYYRVIA